MAKKKSTNKPQQISPANYIKQAARKVPIYECVINEDWEESGLSQILVARKKQNGNIIVGAYIVDTFCLGLKNTLFYHNMTEYEYEQHKKRVAKATELDWVKISPNTCFNIIYGAVEYAEDLGFAPHKDFSITEYILDDVETLEFEDIEFGRDGKPRYISGPYDNVSKVVAKLKKAVGEGNFEVIINMGDFDDDDDDDFDDGDYEEKPHIPMIGFDFMFHESGKVDFRQDSWLKQKAEIFDIDLDANEITLNAVLDFNDATLEIITYMIDKYVKKAFHSNLYLTIKGNSVEHQKKQLFASFFEEDEEENHYTIEANLKESTLTAHFPALAEHKNLKHLIESSPMNKYMDMLIQHILKKPILKNAPTFSAYITYGEKQYFGETEDHISVGFTVE